MCNNGNGRKLLLDAVTNQLSLYKHTYPNCQLNRLQQIQNSLARAIVKAPKYADITPILKYLQWLKVKYKVLSLP